MSFNRLTLFIIAALIASASAKAACASVYDDAFSADITEASTKVAATSAEVSREAKTAAPAPQDETAQLIASISGVYNHQMRDEDRVYVQDNMEIVPKGPGAIYFDIERQSYEGGHASCDISGIARYQNGRFVFKSKEASMMGGPSCRLELRPGAKGIDLIANDGCQDYCGAAMTLDKAQFPYHDRSPLMNVENIKHSDDYKDAVQQDSK